MLVVEAAWLIAMQWTARIIFHLRGRAVRCVGGGRESDERGGESGAREDMISEIVCWLDTSPLSLFHFFTRPALTIPTAPLEPLTATQKEPAAWPSSRTRPRCCGRGLFVASTSARER